MPYLGIRVRYLIEVGLLANKGELRGRIIDSIDSLELDLKLGAKYAVKVSSISIIKYIK